LLYISMEKTVVLNMYTMDHRWNHSPYPPCKQFSAHISDETLVESAHGRVYSLHIYISLTTYIGNSITLMSTPSGNVVISINM